VKVLQETLCHLFSIFVHEPEQRELSKTFPNTSLDAILRDKFGIPVAIMDPFQKVTVDEKDFNPEELAVVGPSMAIAVGLAIRKLGDA